MKTIYDYIYELPKGGVVIEIGGCDGSDTQRLYNDLKPNKLICFEPDHRNYAKIEARNLPIILIKSAVSYDAGSAKLWMSGGKPPGMNHEHTASSSILQPTGHIIKHPCYTFEKQTIVDVTTLDIVIKEHNIKKINFIWCDAQGSEGNIIIGAQHTLSITDYLFCEYSNEELYDGQLKLDEWLRLLPGKWEEVCKWEGDILLKKIH